MLLANAFYRPFLMGYYQADLHFLTFLLPCQVPSVMSQLYPNASITNSSGWAGFPPTQVSAILVAF
jgi:hypothetical protein